MWPYKEVKRKCPYGQQVGEVAAEWARMHREFTGGELAIEVFTRLNLRKVYFRRAVVDVVVDGRNIASWGGYFGDATEMLRDYILGLCAAELQAKYSDKTPHFIDREVAGARRYLYVGAVKDAGRVLAEAGLYGKQELDLRVQREWRTLLASAMRTKGLTASEALKTVNSVDKVKANLELGLAAGAP
jgi:hypothetical protein